MCVFFVFFLSVDFRFLFFMAAPFFLSGSETATPASSASGAIAAFDASLAHDVAAVESVANSIDSVAADGFVSAIENCKGRVMVTGLGKSGVVARRMAVSLASTGTPAHFGQGAALYADMLAIFRALAAVTNNRPGSVGGGGTPRAPVAPPICRDAASNKPTSNEGTLHKVDNCHQCLGVLPSLCKGPFLRSGKNILKSYITSTPLSVWGCRMLRKGSSILQDTSTGDLYVLDSNPLSEMVGSDAASPQVAKGQ